MPPSRPRCRFQVVDIEISCNTEGIFSVRIPQLWNEPNRTAMPWLTIMSERDLGHLNTGARTVNDSTIGIRCLQICAQVKRGTVLSVSPVLSVC